MLAVLGADNSVEAPPAHLSAAGPLVSAVLHARDPEAPLRLIACARRVAKGPDTELWWDAVGEVRICSTAPCAALDTWVGSERGQSRKMVRTPAVGACFGGALLSFLHAALTSAAGRCPAVCFVELRSAKIFLRMPGAAGRGNPHCAPAEWRAGEPGHAGALPVPAQQRVLCGACPIAHTGNLRPPLGHAFG